MSDTPERQERTLRQRIDIRAAIAVALAAGFVGLSTSCAEDRILPVPEVCGDGAAVGTEACDSDSEGCVQCQVAAGWLCPDNECEEICGDETIVGEEDCDPPDGVVCDDSCRTARKDKPCDMSGYWLVRQTDFSNDLLLGQLQVSSTWYVYHFSQAGDAFATVESLSCSLMVSGSATVRPRPAGDQALLYSQGADGSIGQGARSGTFKQVGERCDFTFERWYLLRGLDASFYPEDFGARLELADLPRPMPTTEDALDLSLANPDGVVDMDGDGRPGIALQITGIAAGLRHTAQRDWNEYSTDQDVWPLPTHAIEFTTRSYFKNEETILYVEDCGAACALLQTGSVPSPSEPSRVTFRYLGAELSEPRVGAVIGGPLYADEAVDLATCEQVRQALPHDDRSEAAAR